MLREVVLDTETTGLNPNKGDRIIEIGAVELIDHVPTGKFFHTYVNPERKIPQESTRIHKITDDFIADKPLFQDIAGSLLKFLSDSSLIIHNAEFDLKFLKNELELNNMIWHDRPVVDTLILSKEKYPGSSVSLDSLCKKFNIDVTERKEKGHGALTDSLLLADVYLELLGGKQPHLILDTDDFLNDGSKKETVSFDEKKLDRPSPLNSRLSASDIKTHQKFIEKIGCDKTWKKFFKY